MATANREGPLTSVVVINLNGSNYLPDCLSSLVSQTYPHLEILVADNGSIDDSAAVAARYPVRWEPLGRNYGFAAGNNLGAARAKGEIVVFVNNDMRFDPMFIEKLVEPFLNDPSVFSTDARQLDWNGEHQLHLASRLKPISLTAALGRGGGLLPRHDLEQLVVQSTCDVVQACAGNMAVRRAMFEELGGFDIGFPIGWEDTDICWQAWLRGWRTVFVPEAVCWHHVSMSSATAAGSSYRYRGALGGKILFAMKHLPAEDVALTGARVVAGVITELISGRPSSAWRRLRISAEFSRFAPAALRARRRVYAAAGTSPRRHLSRLSAIGWSDLKGARQEVGPPGRV
jgi:GT2 family glycosyltransferase